MLTGVRLYAMCVKSQLLTMKLVIPTHLNLVKEVTVAVTFTQIETAAVDGVSVNTAALMSASILAAVIRLVQRSPTRAVMRVT